MVEWQTHWTETPGSLWASGFDSRLAYVYEIGDRVKVLKTGYEGKIVGKREMFGKTKYRVEQENGRDIEVEESDLREVK